MWRERIDKDDGVDAQAWRVPWPDLASRSVLTALLQVKEKELWESTIITTVIETVWSKKFKRIHMRVFAIFGVEVLLFMASAALVAAQDPSASLGQLAGTPLGLVALSLDPVLVAFALYFLWREWLQLRSADDRFDAARRRPSVVAQEASRTARASTAAKLREKVFADPWNACDLLSQLLVIGGAVLHVARAPHALLLCWMTVTVVPLCVKMFGCASCFLRRAVHALFSS